MWDLEIDSAVAHGFDIHDDEDAAVAAQDIYREAFLAAVGRNLDALYRQKQQAHAAKYGCRSASTAASEGAPPGERPSHGREKFL